ncbi:AraC family transcriptional regulator [Sphingomonas sp.]|uniref:AraC family transcriptional regulator n=1 Tax=Sphingomonas sp. TaxID=28214 RepID=UPI003B002A13
MTAGAFRVRSLEGGAITAVEACSDQSFVRHAHEEFGVGLVTAGAQRSWSGRGHVEAVAGDLITVNPAEVHDGAAVGASRSWSMLYFSEEIVGAVVADMKEGRRQVRELHAPVVTDARLARLFVSTRTAALQSDDAAAFDEWLVLLLAGLLGTAHQIGSSPPGGLTQVRTSIDDDPAGPHALSDLAAIAGLSRYQTARAFARLTGLTPHAYVVQRRLAVARRLIRQGVTLAGAAADAGFNDQSHMHRVFTARHGYTPGAYAVAHALAAISSKSAMTRRR